MPSRPHRSIPLWALGAVAALVVALRLGSLWPIIAVDLTADPRQALPAAFREPGADVARRPIVDSAAIDQFDRSLGRDAAQAALTSGAPAVAIRYCLRGRNGARDWVFLSPAGRLLGWEHQLDDAQPGAQLDATVAASRAAAELATRLGVTGLRSIGYQPIERPARRDHLLRFTYDSPERSGVPEAITALVAGDAVVMARRTVVVARIIDDDRISRPILISALVLVSAAALAALAILTRRGIGPKWRRVAALCGALAVVLVATRTQPYWLGATSAWDWWGLAGVATVLPLALMLLAAQRLDPEASSRSVDSFWSLMRGRFLDPRVVAASARAVPLALIAGAVLALICTACGWHGSLQPRGYLLAPLYHPLPPVAALLGMGFLALFEEAGYRLFATLLVLRLTRRRWIAVALPALVYGMMHVSQDFVPPSSPEWGRALTMAAVGAVWGIIMLRYDLLTVVLAHITADVALFELPLFAQSSTPMRLAAAAMICVPALPAIAGLGCRLFGGKSFVEQ